MHLVGHPLTYGIDIRFHCERSALGDVGLVGLGEEFPDAFCDLRRHVGCRGATSPSSPFANAPKTYSVLLFFITASYMDAFL